MNSHQKRIFDYICCTLLLLALCPLPYGYYTFLRIIVCIWGCCKSFHFFDSQNSGFFAFLTAGIAILYNPLIPIHLSRDIWTGINIVTIAVILLTIWIEKICKKEN